MTVPGYRIALSAGASDVLRRVPGAPVRHLAWNSRQATSAGAAPDRLVVLGGEVVCGEMAQAWAALGSRVTIVERSDHLLPGHEPFAGEMVAASMVAAGIAVHTATSGKPLLGRRRGRAESDVVPIHDLVPL